MVELVGLVCGGLGLFIGSGVGWYVGQRTLPFWESAGGEERPSAMPKHDHSWAIMGKLDGRVRMECTRSFGGWRCEAHAWQDEVKRG